MLSEDVEKSLNQEDLDRLLEIELENKKEKSRQLKHYESLDYDSDDNSLSSKPEPLKVSDYVNLHPHLSDISFQRSGELLDLKILKENIYLKSKRIYVGGLLFGIIIFVLGVI
ncbi:hypothetical protein GQ473_03765 [archaeon]|nr:hypothetical protein [archaeon]